MKRVFDLLLGVVILVFLVAPMLLISIAARLSSKVRLYIGLTVLEKIIKFLRCLNLDQC